MSKNTQNAIKGIASFMILMYHLKYENIFSSIGGYFGVGAFYFFSGYNLAYCIKNREDYTKKFWPKKFIRIFCPFYIMYLIYQIILYKHFSIEHLYRFIYIDNYCNYFWYVKSLIYIYIVFYIIYSLMKVSKKVNYKWLGIMTWIIAGICMIPFNNDPNHIFASAFIIGWFFAVEDELIKNTLKYRYIILVGLIVLLCLAHMGSYYMYNNVTIYVLSQYSAPCLCGLVCYYLSISFDVNNRIVLFCGMISYELYLVHPVFVRLFENVNMKIPYIIGTICLSYLTAYLLYLFVYKILDRYGKKFLKY